MIDRGMAQPRTTSQLSFRNTQQIDVIAQGPAAPKLHTSPVRQGLTGSKPDRIKLPDTYVVLSEIRRAPVDNSSAVENVYGVLIGHSVLKAGNGVFSRSLGFSVCDMSACSETSRVSAVPGLSASAMAGPIKQTWRSV